jgi:transposase
MPKRVLTDERIRARELFVYYGYTVKEIAFELSVHEDSVYAWLKKDGWETERKEILTTPVEIAIRLKKILLHLMEEIDQKQVNKEPIRDSVIFRLEKYTKTLVNLDKNYDEKGAILLAMRRFTAFLMERKEKEALKVLNAVFPDFFRSLRDEKK